MLDEVKLRTNREREFGRYELQRLPDWNAQTAAAKLYGAFVRTDWGGFRFLKRSTGRASFLPLRLLALPRRNSPRGFCMSKSCAISNSSSAVWQNAAPHFITILAVLALLILVPPRSKGVPKGKANDQIKIMTWAGTSADWQHQLHVSGLRVGCSGAPQSCMKYVSSIKSPAKAYFLSVLLKPDTVAYGAEYSALSRQQSNLQEIGLDDFVSQYWKLYNGGVSDPPSVLNQFIDGIKSVNPKLRFGATIYENDIGGEYLSDKDLPPALRAKFDVVHFFIHYRGDSPKYAEYVAQLKQIFPNAEIAGGLYVYDRISYLPCLPKGQPCSDQQELANFDDSLNAAMSLAQQGAVSWIELFPGVFGHEADWGDWKNPKLCPGRLDDCVANTKKMDEAVVAKIKQVLG
jgi:hypothetical protein